MVAGLYVGHTTPLVQSGTARITTSNWRTVAFVLENRVFLLIGLELRDILEQVDSSGQPWVRIALVTIGVFLTCILARSFGCSAAELSPVCWPAARAQLA